MTVSNSNILFKHKYIYIQPINSYDSKDLISHYDGGSIPAAFTLTETTVTPSGVIFANYKRSGDVKTGTVGS